MGWDSLQIKIGGVYQWDWDSLQNQKKSGVNERDGWDLFQTKNKGYIRGLVSFSKFKINIIKIGFKKYIKKLK